MSKATAHINVDKAGVDVRTVFPKENYKIMIAGLVIIVVGFLLMLGGNSNDPNSFKPEEVYSFRRITLAPIVILLGLVVEIYAIMRRPK
jgi:fumarate reductase subunit D